MPIARRTVPLQGAPSTPDDVGSRPASVLPRAAARRGDVQPVLLVPRRPADVRGSLRVRPLGDDSRPGDACGFCSLRRGAQALRPSESTTASTWRWRRGERRTHLRDYREAGSVNGLLALWGFVDETTFLTKAGHVGVVYRIRGVDYEGLYPSAAPGARRIGSKPRCDFSTSTAASTSTSASARSTRSSPLRVSRRSPNEAIQRRAAYLNDRRARISTTSTLFLVLLYEAPHVRGAARSLRSRLAGTPRRPCGHGCRPITS